MDGWDRKLATKKMNLEKKHMSLQINDDAFLICSCGAGIAFRGPGVTQLAVPLRAVSNFISCKNTKIPAVVVTRFTQQTEKEEEEEGGMDGGVE